MAITSSGPGHPDTLPVSTCDKPAPSTNNQQSPALNSTLHHHGQSSNLNDCQTHEPLTDSGARKCEVVAIKTNDVDLGKNCIKVIGKGNKEGYRYLVK